MKQVRARVYKEEEIEMMRVCRKVPPKPPNVLIFKTVFCDSPEKKIAKNLLQELVQSVHDSVKKRGKITDPKITNKHCMIPNMLNTHHCPYVHLVPRRNAVWLKCGGDDCSFIEMSHIILSQMN